MSLLADLIGLVLSLIIWILASPVIFGILETIGLSGANGFIAVLIPWTVALLLVGRLLWTFRTGGGP